MLSLLLSIFIAISNAQCANINSLPNQNLGFRALTYNLEGWHSAQDGFNGIKRMLYQLQYKDVDVMGFQEADRGANSAINSVLAGMGMYQVLFQDPPGVALYANRRWRNLGGQNIPVGHDGYHERYLNVAVLQNSAGKTIQVANYHGCLEPTNPHDYGCQNGVHRGLSTAGFFSQVSRSVFLCDCNDYKSVINNGGTNSLNRYGMKVINKPCGGLAGFDWIAVGSDFTMKQRYSFGGSEGAYTSDHSAMLIDFYYGGGPSPPGPTPAPSSCCLYQNQCISDPFCNASRERCLGPCNTKGDKRWGPPGRAEMYDNGVAGNYTKVLNETVSNRKM